MNLYILLCRKHICYIDYRYIRYIYRYIDTGMNSSHSGTTHLIL